MKSMKTLLLLASLGLLAGCSTKIAEPAPSPAPVPGPASAPAATKVGAMPGDVSVSKIFPRPAQTVDRQPVQASSPSAPGEKIAYERGPQETFHNDALHIVPKAEKASVHQIAIDATDGEAMLYLSPQAADKDAIHAALRNIEVIGPDGNRVNARVPKSSGLADDDYLPMSAIPLAGLPVGVYTVKVNPIAGKAGLAVDVRQPESKIVMKLLPSTNQHLLGNEAFVDVTLSEAGVPVVGANVTGHLVQAWSGADSNGVTFQEIGNGVYRTAIHGALAEADAIGAYLTDVRAEGTAPSGRAFLRHGRAGFHYGVPTARVTDVASTRVITNDKGLVTGFEVDVALDSSSLDRLEISGTLATIGPDGAEHPVATAATGAGYDVGHHVATLHFDAGHVRLTGLDGTLVLRHLSVYSLGTNTLFHRSGQSATSFPSVQRASLAPVAEITPQIAGMIHDGLLPPQID